VVTQAWFPPGPPFLLKYGALAHKSHLVDLLATGFQIVRCGLNGQAFKQAWQPMHFLASIMRTLLLAALTWHAPVGQFLTHIGSGH
jgi:hypothetical protein